MPKVDVAEVEKLGFDKSQFGAPTDWATADTGYLALIINYAGAMALDAVGATLYALTTGATFERIKRAELLMVEAELWRRLAVRLTTNARAGNQASDSAYLTVREYGSKSSGLQAQADDLLARVANGHAGSAASSTVVETGLYPPVSS